MKHYQLLKSFVLKDTEFFDKISDRKAFVRYHGEEVLSFMRDMFNECEDLELGDIYKMLGCYERFMDDVVSIGSMRNIRLEHIGRIAPKYSKLAMIARSLDFRRRCGKVSDTYVKYRLSRMYYFLWSLWHKNDNFEYSQGYIYLDSREYKPSSRTGDNSGTIWVRRERLFRTYMRVLYYISRYFKDHQSAIDYAKENYEASSLYKEFGVRYCYEDKYRSSNRKSKG